MQVVGKNRPGNRLVNRTSSRGKLQVRRTNRLRKVIGDLTGQVAELQEEIKRYEKWRQAELDGKLPSEFQKWAGVTYAKNKNGFKKDAPKKFCMSSSEDNGAKSTPRISGDSGSETSTDQQNNTSTKAEGVKKRTDDAERDVNGDYVAGKPIRRSTDKVCKTNVRSTDDKFKSDYRHCKHENIEVEASDPKTMNSNRLARTNHPVKEINSAKQTKRRNAGTCLNVPKCGPPDTLFDISQTEEGFLGRQVRGRLPKKDGKLGRRQSSVEKLGKPCDKEPTSKDGLAEYAKDRKVRNHAIEQRSDCRPGECLTGTVEHRFSIQELEENKASCFVPASRGPPIEDHTDTSFESISASGHKLQHDDQLSAPITCTQGNDAHEQPVENRESEIGNSLKTERKSFLFPDGTRMEVYPDGLSCTYFSNGDIKNILIDGTIEYYYAGVDTWHMTKSNGEELFYVPENSEGGHAQEAGQMEFPDTSHTQFQPKPLAGFVSSGKSS